ncbi:hypothetical protein NBO_69g0012 [Nosema bombycis CQ1]|uniref:Uncharacterized protein n=1 Tax=Nosema bombycis (strain CQ1 / CVCC 102059) TaxID=578461 RepID=R0ML35_NOSB1|nr:hypothetical protein NBO_69g0012 [Nosema bombycis CQ1]|eukprot:EOB13518.1 hypothetical protein NBO_69g0012 [Nosema bombycis CQ1]
MTYRIQFFIRYGRCVINLPMDINSMQFCLIMFSWTFFKFNLTSRTLHGARKKTKTIKLKLISLNKAY